MSLTYPLHGNGDAPLLGARGPVPLYSTSCDAAVREARRNLLFPVRDDSTEPRGGHCYPYVVAVSDGAGVPPRSSGAACLCFDSSRPARPHPCQAGPSQTSGLCQHAARLPSRPEVLAHVASIAHISLLRFEDLLYLWQPTPGWALPAQSARHPPGSWLAASGPSCCGKELRHLGSPGPTLRGVWAERGLTTPGPWKARRK